jgi:hypothetical protein
VEVTPQQIIEIERECTQLLVRSLRWFDQQDWQQYVQHFADNGILVRSNLPHVPVQGREAIENALRTRPAQRLTRHHLTNIHINVIDANHATGFCYALVATANLPNNATSADRPLDGWHADAPFKSGEYIDEYVHVNNVWCIARREGRIIVSSK